jgi:hypothetical protein
MLDFSSDIHPAEDSCLSSGTHFFSNLSRRHGRTEIDRLCACRPVIKDTDNADARARLGTR